MGFILVLLTFALVVNCSFLILLILVQLPKKEAGAGTAFGGAATDALFGAGTGNALTKLTRYSAALFFALSLMLSILNAGRAHQSSSGVKEELKKQATMPTRTPTTPSVNTPPAPQVSNILESLPPPTAASNLLSGIVTNLNVSKAARNRPAARPTNVIKVPVIPMSPAKPATNPATASPAPVKPAAPK